jgi:hypothetical protein
MTRRLPALTREPARAAVLRPWAEIVHYDCCTKAAIDRATRQVRKAPISAIQDRKSGSETGHSVCWSRPIWPEFESILIEGADHLEHPIDVAGQVAGFCHEKPAKGILVVEAVWYELVSSGYFPV